MANELTQKWTIKDLKGVGDVELSLDDSKRAFVFFGSNGIGKTKTLEALFVAFLASNSEFDMPSRYGSFENFFRELYSSNLKLQLFFDTEYIDIETLRLSEYRQSFAIAYVGAHRRSETDYNRISPLNVLGGFHQRKIDLFDTFEKALFTVDGFKSLGMYESINQWFVLRAQSVNPYQKVGDNRKVEIDTILTALHKLDNRFEKKLNVDADGGVFLTIEGQERELSELSSGFISVVKIIQAIVSAYSAFTNEKDLLNIKGVVLIDEIESHLHVEWQTKIIPTLKEIFSNTTFYIATHSPLVLSQLDEGEAYLLKREEDGVVRSHVIDSPNKRILANVLRDAFGIDLNELKRESMEDSSQDLAKYRLLKLLRNPAGDDSE